MKKILDSPIPALAMVCFLLLTDRIGFVRMALAASLLHETGHCVVYWLQTGKIPHLSFNLYGISLKADNVFQNRIRQTYLLLGGCMANALACIAILLLIDQRATYHRYFFLAANFLTACYNLLPVGVLDGARLLRLWLPIDWAWLMRIIEKTTLFALCAVLCVFFYQQIIPLKMLFCLLPAAAVPLFQTYLEK